MILLREVYICMYVDENIAHTMSSEAYTKLFDFWGMRVEPINQCLAFFGKMIVFG